jgi:hypothetical protein
MTLSPLKNLKKIYTVSISHLYLRLLIFHRMLAVPSPTPTRMSHRRRDGRSPTHILLMNRSLFTGLPFFPSANRGVSVHISLTFSKTMLQCRSNALTRARSFLLLRIEMSTCTCERTAVWRIDRGPAENSCSSSWAISYSLQRNRWVSHRQKESLEVSGRGLGF